MSSQAVESWLLESSSTAGSVTEFYAALGVELKDRGGEEAAVRCFANPAAHNRDDRTASCSVNLSSGLFHCKGCGEKGNSYQAALRLGRTETDARNLARSFGLFLETKKEKRPNLPTERRCEIWRHEMRSNEQVLERCRVVKGWTPEAIQRLGVGWDGERIVFVIRNNKYKICGVVRYLPGGNPKTLAMPGTKRDLFPNPECIHQRHPIFLVEGEADAVAIWSLGLFGVAIPGTGSWKREWGWRFNGRKIVFLMDADEPGRLLGDRIRNDVTNAQVVDLEPSLSDGTDVGDLLVQSTKDGGSWQLKRMLESLIA